ncbi:NAD-dependent 4,6-dehydratase LegB [soil metagenome]
MTTLAAPAIERQLSGRRILVTGAGGFIGSHLVERLLAAGAQVRALVHYNSRSHWGHLESVTASGLLEILPGDVCDPSRVSEAMAGCDTVFHLAALIAIPYSYVCPTSYVQTNVLGTLNVLEAARRHGVRRVVHTSTSETYGTARYVPIDEAHPLQGQSPYSASKIGADKLAESYFLSFGLPVATVRPFNTYGPRQSARAVIPTIISQILAGKSSIRLGSLLPQRDFNFVDDTVEGFIAVAEAAGTSGEVVNIGSGQGISIGDTVALIQDLMGSAVDIACDEDRVRPAASEVMQLICANDKARRLTGWQPHTSLRDGLARTIDYVREHREDYKAGVYNV